MSEESGAEWESCCHWLHDMMAERLFSFRAYDGYYIAKKHLDPRRCTLKLHTVYLAKREGEG